MLRLVVSLGALIGLGWYLDAAGLASRLLTLQPEWVAVGLVISVVQVAASAWRWRFTAGRLGIDLPFRDALREYYLATFLNQVLPGGIAGDASRAWRHARRRQRIAASPGPAVRAVILERASGQALMTVVAIVSLQSLPVAHESLAWDVARWTVAALAAVATGLVLVAVRGRPRTSASFGGRMLLDTHAALLSRSAFPAQLGSSALVVGTYIATFLVASRAVGVTTPVATLLPLVGPVLFAMLLPVSIAGWGVREGAAALLWVATGLPVTDGVVVSLAYGLLTLVSSLPGALALLGVGGSRPLATEVAEPRPPGGRLTRDA